MQAGTPDGGDFFIQMAHQQRVPEVIGDTRSRFLFRQDA